MFMCWLQGPTWIADPQAKYHNLEPKHAVAPRIPAIPVAGDSTLTARNLESC